jgi:hypothetical protein
MGKEETESGIVESEGSVVTTSSWLEEKMKKDYHYFFLCDSGIILEPKHRKITLTRIMLDEILRMMNAIKEKTITISSKAE